MSKNMTEGSLADVTMMMHELSMSQEPLSAAAGRLGKRLIPQLDQWLDDELERNTGSYDCTMAGVSVLMGMIVTITQNNAREGRAASALEQVREVVNDFLDKAIEDMKELEAEAANENATDHGGALQS
jgi:hypothetical protein